MSYKKTVYPVPDRCGRHRIDQLVYDLYGLTEEEIKLLEDES